MRYVARGTFEVEITPSTPELDGAVNRFELRKRFSGDLAGAGSGLMLAAADPSGGTAGYVAIETVHGTLGDRDGGFAMQQFGTMVLGVPTLHYEVVPGSGSGGLTGTGGVLHLTVEADGTHRFEMEYEL